MHGQQNIKITNHRFLHADELDSHVTKFELTEHVLKMKKRKATGYEGIPAKVWKMFRYKTFYLKFSMKLRMRKISLTGKLRLFSQL